MDLTEILLRVISGGVIGYVIGLTGIGGGVLVLPTLTLLMGLPATVAVGTAGLYSFLTKVVATWRHIKLQTVDFRCAAIFLTGALPANLITSVLMTRYVTDPANSAEDIARFQSGLNVVMVAMILLSAVVMIWSTLRKFRPKATEGPGVIGSFLAARPKLAKGFAFFGGAFIGAEIGATSIGGGTLLVVLLIVVLGMTAGRTVGTSVFISVLLTLITSIVYMSSAQVDYPTALWMAAGSFVGVYFGSQMTVKSSDRNLNVVMTGLVIIAALMMLIKGGH